jgi:hypothetical protein
MLVAVVLASPRAAAQLVFSIDYKGPSHSAPGGTVLLEGDALVASGTMVGPLPPPTVFLTTQQLGIGPGSCTVPANGVPCGVELDALSFGDDKAFNLASSPAARAKLFFSVDWAAVGLPTSAPSVFSEHAFNDAAADVFTVPDLPGALPLAPGAIVPPRNFVVFDGDGHSSGPGTGPRRGLGLVEPHGVPNSTPPYANVGDDLDALHISPAMAFPTHVFFSLDGAITDPLSGIPGSNSAGLTGRRPGSIYERDLPNGAVVEYASASTLGLDIFGVNSDDLDVLILHENGVPGYQKSTALYDWLPGTPGGPRDMVVFSVRRGSALVVQGVHDFLLNLPIEEGDLLVPPPIGLATMPPGIIVAAENLGLRTRRAGFALSDDVDAGSTGEICYDCNTNGIEDAVDIATGSSADANNNGIPDECEQEYTSSCTCPSSVPPPCSNPDANAGCRNSTGVGGLLVAGGTTSVGLDDLVLSATQLPPPATGIWLRSSTTMAETSLKDGLFCLGSRFLRFGTAGPGSASKGPGMVTQSCSGPNCMVPGATWNFQYYYRNVAGPCHLGANLTNMVSVTWTP